jgi:hypothetical protein
MKIHLAAQAGRREEMRRVARRLERAGHTVSSRWIHGRGKGARADNAMYELADIVVADCVVLFTESSRSRIPLAESTGRHVGFGYALRAGKRIVAVGPLENIFCRLAEVERVPTIKRLLEVLSPGGGSGS